MDETIPANSSLLGRSPPSPGGAPPELTEAKKAGGNRRRTTSNTRHRYTALTQHNHRTVKCFSRLSNIMIRLKSCVCRTRRDTINEDNHRSQELLHFNSSFLGELVVHRGKSLGESCLRPCSCYGAM